jgi:hypothetical protein
MLGTAYATNISGYTILGEDGWRFAFRTVAIVAVLIGLATLRFAKDPSQIEGLHEDLINEKKGLRDTLAEFRQVWVSQESACCARRVELWWREFGELVQQLDHPNWVLALGQH